MENYEEKYKHALENFKKIKSANSDNKELVNFIEYEYPELNKSENERIKRCIQVALIDVDEKRFNDYDTTLKDCLFWLEKQGEQKSVDKVDVLMSLDEAIEHCKEKSHCNNACALEHKQLEKWLTEFEKCVQNILNEPHFQDVQSVKQFSKTLLDLARKEILKDLPKWKRSNSFFNTGNKFELGKTSLRRFDGYEIPYSELEKIPKEE